MFDRVKRYITLQHARFRRVFLVIIPLVAVALIILASLPLDLISSKWGNQFTQAAVLLLLVVLVEHVANSTDRFQTLEGSVDNLETSVGQIRASLGVRESIEVYNRDYAASRKQREFIHNRNPEKARLCEYSSNTVADLIWDLNEVGTTQSVELLICHPDKAVNTWQTGHILDRMSTLANRIDVEQAQSMGLQIKCYENPASLRGRLIDDELVVVGLYTHDRRSHLSSTDQQIWGG
jgi:hypothetical protein